MTRTRKTCSECGRKLETKRFPLILTGDRGTQAACLDCVNARDAAGNARNVPACPICKRRPIDGHDSFCTPERRALSPYPVPTLEVHRHAEPIAPARGEKLCTGPCCRVLPETIEHFQRSGRGGFWPICKRCHVVRVNAGLQASGARRKAQYGEGVA